MRRLVTLAGVGAVLAGVVLHPSSADATSAPPSQVVAAWAFDAAGADGTIGDVSGLGHPLAVAGRWSLGSGSAGTGAVRFTAQSFGTTMLPAPEASEVAVTAVLRSLVPKPFKDTPNVLQDGLFGDPSQVKMQLAKTTKGEAQCRFKGSLGAILLNGPSVAVNDGAWHTVTCWRQGATVGVTVDAKTTTAVFDVGSISPIRPMTVAARGLLQGDLSDQFIGDIDAVVWAAGDGARSAAPTYAAALAGTTTANQKA